MSNALQVKLLNCLLFVALSLGWICKMKPNDNPGPRRTLLKADKQLPKPTSGSSPRKDQNLAVRLHPLLPESAGESIFLLLTDLK